MPLYLGVALNAGAYAIDALRRGSVSLSRASMLLLFAFGMLLLISYFFRVEQTVPRLRLVATMAMSALFVALGRIVIARIIRTRCADRLFAQMILLDRVRLRVPPTMVAVEAERVGLQPDLRDPTMMNRFASLVRRCDRVVVACPPAARLSWAMMLKGAGIKSEVVVEGVSELGVIGSAASRSMPR